MLAVEEDFDVHILELTQIEEQEEYINSTFALQKNGDETAFEEGYHNALLDMFSSMLHLGSRPVSMSNGNGHKSRLTPIIDQPFRPIQPIPKPFPQPFPIIEMPKQPVPWNISMVKAPQAWNRGLKGSGVKVAFLDTGIPAHPDLAIEGGFHLSAVFQVIMTDIATELTAPVLSGPEITFLEL